jgi:hypothetical protein
VVGAKALDIQNSKDVRRKFFDDLFKG